MMLNKQVVNLYDVLHSLDENENIKQRMYPALS